VAFSFTTDDAFISLRYARHLSEGLGLVWDKGGPPLEGFSNFLWVMCEAILFYFNLNVLVIMKCVAVFCLFGSVCALYRISRFFLSPALSVLPSLMMLFNRGEIIWTVSGLETAAFQLSVLLIVFCLLEAIKTNRRILFGLAGFFQAVSALLRPEAPFLMIGFVCCLYLVYRVTGKDKKDSIIRGTVSYVGIFLCCYLPYFLWHFYYFWRAFPNTVYCKGLMSAVPGYLDFEYLLVISPLLILTLPLFLKKWDRRYSFLLLPSIVYLMILINAEVIVAYFNRLFLPAMILIFPLFVCGIQSLIQLLRPAISKEKVIAYTVIMVCCLSFFLIPSYLPLSNYRSFVGIQALSAGQRHKIGLWLKSHVKKGEKVTLSDCGLIPYTFDGMVIDTYCLNSRKMTSSPINLSYARFTDWVLDSQKPSFIILLAVTQQRTAYSPPFDLMIAKREAFKHCYQKETRFMVGDNMNGYYYDIFRRKC
jgi:hypothetical protein